MNNIPFTVKKVVRCDACNNTEMVKQDYQNPYITRSGRTFLNIKVDVYKCPICGKEKEDLPNEEDGYSLGGGLFCDE